MIRSSSDWGGASSVGGSKSRIMIIREWESVVCDYRYAANAQDGMIMGG